MTDSPIDEVLEAARVALLTRRGEAAERVARIKAAADAYLRATEQDIAAQFAARQGLEVQHASQTVRAALDLRAAVDSLPEVHVRPATQYPSTWSAAPPRASIPPTLDVRPARDAAADATLSPTSEEFVREVRAANLDEAPTDLFRVYTEEFAARARHLQQTFADRPADVEALGRVIRTLTAMVAKRGLTGIYGLSRNHSGDWQARAEEAVRKRQRLLSIPPSAPTGVSASGADGSSEPELEVVGGVGADDEEEDRRSDPPIVLERLRAANLDGGAVVIVGGSAKPEKLERLKRRSDLVVEWVPVEPGSTTAVASLEKRIRDGRLAALVVLQDLMPHKHFDPLIAAARQAGLAWAYGGKAGKASLERALGEIEATLSRRAGAG